MNRTYAYLRNDRKIKFRMLSAQQFINEAPDPFNYTNVLLKMSITVKKKKEKLSQLKSLRQPASADFSVFSTYFLGDFSTFCCINLKQEVQKTQKSAEAGCLKLLSWLNFSFFFTVYKIRDQVKP